MALFETDIWVTEKVKQLRTLTFEAESAEEAKQLADDLVNGEVGAEDTIWEWGDVQEEVLFEAELAEFEFADNATITEA